MLRDGETLSGVAPNSVAVLPGTGAGRSAGSFMAELEKSVAVSSLPAPPPVGERRDLYFLHFVFNRLV